MKLYQCDPCKSEDKQTDAEYQCTNCVEKLCTSCRATHRKFPKLRNHDVKQLESNPLVCTACKSDDIVREASCFCKDCDEYLCKDCKTDHKKFKKLQGHTLKDIEKQDRDDKNKHTGPASDDSELSASGPEDMGLHTPPTDDARGSQATAPSIESHLAATNIGEDSPMSTGLNEPFKFLNVSFKNVNVIKLKGSDDERLRIHGCEFLPSGDLLLVNNYGGEVLHLDSSFTIRQRLKISCLEIAVIGENTAVAAGSKKFQFFEVSPKLRIIKNILSGDEGPVGTRGIAAGGGLIYVSCNKGGDDKGHIRVFDYNGKYIRKIDAIQNGQVLFDKPYHLAASATRVYLSGEALTCFKSDGTLVYQYKDEKLRKVSGIVVDSEDNVISCAYGSEHAVGDKFHMITANGQGQMCQTVEKSLKVPGYNCSDCIAYRPSDKTLVMGSFENLYIFKLA